ncbi:MAG: response regulator [Chloroflexi bacterium OHK40]
MLAEDEPDIQLITRLALEEAGCTVVAVGDGRAAIEAAQHGQFDVALLDVMMPRMDGFTACARLREDPRTQRLPVIFLTARSQELEVQHGLALGAQGYIVKPFDVFRLAVRIGELLGEPSASS